MKKSTKRSLFAGFSSGLDSFVNPRTPSAEDLRKARQLREEAARLRSITARVRELKAAGLTREQVIEASKQGFKMKAKSSPWVSLQTVRPGSIRYGSGIEITNVPTTTGTKGRLEV